MLKILTDECVHTDLVSALKQIGHNVRTLKEAGLVGTDDEAVFKLAQQDRRILLTFDRGFGDVFRFNINHAAGVIIILIEQMTREEIISITLDFLNLVKQSEIAGKLAIVNRNKIRIIKR